MVTIDLQNRQTWIQLPYQNEQMHAQRRNDVWAFEEGNIVRGSTY
jgi:hypothetical protein